MTQPHSLSRLKLLSLVFFILHNTVAERNSATGMQSPFAGGQMFSCETEVASLTSHRLRMQYCTAGPGRQRTTPMPQSLRQFIFQHEGPAGFCLFLACFY